MNLIVEKCIQYLKQVSVRLEDENITSQNKVCSNSNTVSGCIFVSISIDYL